MSKKKKALFAAIPFCIAVLLACSVPGGNGSSIVTHHIPLVTFGSSNISAQIDLRDPPDPFNLTNYKGWFAVTLKIGSMTISNEDPKFQCIADLATDLTKVYIFESDLNVSDFIVTGYDCYQAVSIMKQGNHLMMKPLDPLSSTGKLYILFGFTSDQLRQECSTPSSQICQRTGQVGVSQPPR